MSDMVTEVTIKKWVKRGIFLLNTEALDHDDPDHVYNQILQQGGKPELFGYRHPMAERFDTMSKDELIKLVLDLEHELKMVQPFL